MNKKLISMLAAVTLLVSMTSCGSGSSSGSSSKAETTAATESLASEETAASTETTTAASTQATEASTASVNKCKDYASMTPEQITASLTLEQKVSQMLQPAVYKLEPREMQTADYGSMLSLTDPLTSKEWRECIDSYQKAAVESEAGLPIIYGQDDVHGVYGCVNGVVFPHQIGMGAANDPELLYQVGLATADESKLCHVLLTFSPCLAQSADPRWGRTYESYGSDLEIIKSLSTSFTKGLLDGGLVVCPKHYIAEGNVEYGSGEDSKKIDRLIDRGDTKMSDEELEKHLELYKAQIEAGAQVIMISHSALNGVKMHENKEYIQLLRTKLGFEGVILSDWESIQNTSPATYHDQLVKSINAGIDMLMEPETFIEAKNEIIAAVNAGEIEQSRIDDAVTRIIRMKKDAGLIDDPLFEKLDTKQTETGSDEYRALAEKLVEESLVLLKNENGALPLKSGTSIFITGPAADNAQAQCGGWTLNWNSSPDKNIKGATTFIDGFRKYAEKYGINVIIDKNKASEADVVLLALGEKSYAEWNGDTEDMELCGELGLEGNAKAISEAKELGKPTVACIIAGRQVILPEEDMKNWDSIVMCYLPGTEAGGIANVLCGGSDFRGKLPSPWYSSVSQIGTNDCWLEKGYGLTYGA